MTLRPALLADQPCRPGIHNASRIAVEQANPIHGRAQTARPTDARWAAKIQFCRPLTQQDCSFRSLSFSHQYPDFPAFLPPLRQKFGRKNTSF